MVNLANRPYRQRRDLELDNARRRDKENARLDAAAAQTRYYERCEKQNAKFEQFTSPRYYEENNKLHTELRIKKEKAEKLETRREKLRKLFMEEDQTFSLEDMMSKCTPRSWEDPESTKHNHKIDQVPIELLKQVNNDIKHSEEKQRRHRAESALYDQWKRDSACVRDAERRCNLDKVKMSWLDQQIQKRMQKEQEEEETRQYIAQTKQAIEEQRKEEEEFKKEAEIKRDNLRRDLEKQMDEILRREEESNKLRLEEEAVRLKGAELQLLEDKWEEDERRRRSEDVALANQRFHKRKLELKAQNVLKSLEEEKLFIKRLQDAELCEKIHNQHKRLEIQSSMNEFLGLVNDLKDLEGKRMKHMQFTFDSEAPKVFQQFDQAWKKEEELRKGLVKGILKDLKQQIEDNLEKSRDEQRVLLKEREEMLERMNRQKEEINEVKVWEERKKLEYRRCLDQQVQWKKVREKELKEIEREKREVEFEKLRCEEMRLKEEIMRMQRGQPVATHGRRRFFY